MSIDTEAMKQVIAGLRSMAKRADRAAAREKSLRDAQAKQLLADYQTYEDIQEAYGYALITEDERQSLLTILEGRDDPKRTELSMEEIYALEIHDLIKLSQKRLRDLGWEELPDEEKERSLRQQKEWRDSLKRRGGIR